MFESVIRSQLPSHCVLNRLTQERLARMNTVVSAGEACLGRRFDVYLANGPGSVSFILESDTKHAIVFGLAQRNLISIAREILVPGTDDKEKFPNLAASLMLHISALDALYFEQGNLAATLFCQSLIVAAPIVLHGAVPADSEGEGGTISEGRLCVWSLAILHEMGHIQPHRAELILGCVRDVRKELSARMYREEVVLFPGIRPDLEASLQSGALSEERLLLEAQADAFAIECLLVASKDLLGRDTDITTVAAECVVWLWSMATVERLQIRLRATGMVHPQRIRYACILSDAHFHARILTACYFVSLLLHRSEPDRANLMASMMAMYRDVRKNDATIDLNESAVAETTEFQRYKQDDAFVAIVVERTLEGVPWVEVIGTFLESAGSLETPLLRELRAAVRPQAR